MREITLPLRHDDIIRQQSADKRLDPALVAAVIYEESKFRDQTSHAGARGLMQITPATAEFIAHQSGGTGFVQEDLATPSDQHQLRHLLPALSARPLRPERDPGGGCLQRGARQRGPLGRAGPGEPDDFDVSDIRFPETRAYVTNVLERRGEYRDHYGDELGL